MSVISLDILVDDLASALALFDVIQVWRSTNGTGGPFYEITAPAVTKAAITSTPGPWNLHSKTLTIVLNAADPLDIVFTGADPFNLTAVIQAINSVIPGLAAQTGPNLNTVTLTSPVTGTGSSIIVSGTGATALGLPTTKVNGQAARIPLVNPTTDYKFQDFDGDPSYLYKTRYYNSLTHSVSSFSAPRQGNPQVVLPGSALSKATVNLVNGAGQPIVGRRIIFVPINVQQVLVAGSPAINYGVLPGFDRIIMQTDQTGHAEASLVKGETFRVFFEGSQYQREFVVPNTDFDLLTVLSTEPDVFDIVQAPPMPIRTS